MSTPRPVRFIEEWATIAFTALPPGWVNVYKDDDEPAVPCPGVLIQELRKTTRCEDQPTGGSPPYRLVMKETPADQPYETRAVFADYEGAYLAPVDDVVNYERTEFRP